MQPITAADHHRAELLAEHHTANSVNADEPEPQTYVQSQAALRAEAINAFKDLNGDDDDDEDNFELSARPKPDKEVEREVNEYRAFLLEMGGGEEEVRRTLGLDSKHVNVLADDEKGEDDNESESEAAASDVSEVLDSPQQDKGPKRKRQGGAGKKRADEDFLMG